MVQHRKQPEYESALLCRFVASRLTVEPWAIPKEVSLRGVHLTWSGGRRGGSCDELPDLDAFQRAGREGDDDAFVEMARTYGPLLWAPDNRHHRRAGVGLLSSCCDLGELKGKPGPPAGHAHGRETIELWRRVAHDLAATRLIVNGLRDHRGQLDLLGEAATILMPASGSDSGTFHLDRMPAAENIGQRRLMLVRARSVGGVGMEPFNPPPVTPGDLVGHYVEHLAGRPLGFDLRFTWDRNEPMLSVRVHGLRGALALRLAEEAMKVPWPSTCARCGWPFSPEGAQRLCPSCPPLSSSERVRLKRRRDAAASRSVD